MTLIKTKNKIHTFGLIALGTLSLTACGAADRVANIGKAPDLTPIENPVEQSNYKPVSMPMPTPEIAKQERNSLWGSNRQTFFKDQRASNVGDILTVVIEINDAAELENESERIRSSNEEAGLNSLLGYEQALDQVLPEAVDNTDLIDGGANSLYRGEGNIEREEEIRMKLAAIVTQILPNGNLAIQGRQEVRVNFEKRILELAGVIRPEDISPQNTISYEQIAEARISYGGEGQMTDYQQPRYGQQLYDIIFPF